MKEGENNLDSGGSKKEGDEGALSPKASGRNKVADSGNLELAVPSNDEQSNRLSAASKKNGKMSKSHTPSRRGDAKKSSKE